MYYHILPNEDLKDTGVGTFSPDRSTGTEEFEQDKYFTDLYSKRRTSNTKTDNITHVVKSQSKTNKS